MVRLAFGVWLLPLCPNAWEDGRMGGVVWCGCDVKSEVSGHDLIDME